MIQFFPKSPGREDGDSPKPPRPGTGNSGNAASPAMKPQQNNLHPFALNGPSRQNKKSIPDILEPFGKINFGTAFNGRREIKLGNLYQIITSDLGVDLGIEDLKDLQRYLKRQDSQDADVEFMDRDESLVDLQFL